MTQQLIGLGAVANDGTGDPLRTALDKVNDNFTELYNERTRILRNDASPLSLTGTTAETIILAVTISGNLLGLKGLLQSTQLWSYTNNANTKTLRIRFGGIGGTIYFNSGSLTTTASLRHQIQIQNRGSAASQIGGLSSVGAQWAASTAAFSTSAIDTTSAVDLVFTGQLGNSADTITLESVLLELLPGA